MQGVTLRGEARLYQEILGSIVVSMSACHADDPGSIPGRGVRFFFFPYIHIPIRIYVRLLPGSIPWLGCSTIFITRFLLAGWTEKQSTPLRLARDMSER